MNKIYLIFALFLISCSDDKFKEEHEDWDIEIYYNITGENLYLHDIDEELKYYFWTIWTIDGDTVYPNRNYKVGYGTHFVKLVLIDTLEDTISVSKLIPINEPLKITLLSPIDSFSGFKEKDTVEFIYKCKEKAEVYVRSNTEEDWKKTDDKYELDKSIFWQVRAGTTVSETRYIWLKD